MQVLRFGFTSALATSLLAACISTPPKAPSGPFSGAFTLLYQGGRGGVTEPCGCHTTPYGGIDREFNAVKQIREQAPHTLFVEAGNSFAPEKLTAPVDTYRDKALAMVEMLNENTLQVLSPGPWDLALGVDFLKEAKKKARFAFVNSSLKDKEGKLLFDSHYIADFNGFKVAVLAVSPKGKGPQWSAGAPEKVLSDSLKEIQGKADWIVVLSQLSHRQNEKLAEDFPQVQVVIGCDPKSTIERAYYFGKTKTLLLDPHISGYRLGKLEANVKLPFSGFYSVAEIVMANEELDAWKKQVTEKKRVTEAKANIERILSQKQLAPVPNGTQVGNQLIGLSKEEYGTPNVVTELLNKYQAALREKALSK